MSDALSRAQILVAPVVVMVVSATNVCDQKPSQQSLPARSPLIAEHTLPLLRDALEEMYALGQVLFPATPQAPGLDADIVTRTLQNTARLHCVPESAHRPSMLVDVENGRPMELDVVVGEVVRLGRAHGIAMPVSLYQFPQTLGCVCADKRCRGSRQFTRCC